MPKIKRMDPVKKFIRQLKSQKSTELVLDELTPEKMTALKKEAREAVDALWSTHPESFTEKDFTLRISKVVKVKGTFLHLAVKKSYFFCEALLEKGIDVNLQNADGDTALHVLAESYSNYSTDILKLLVNTYQADITLLNNANQSAFQIALSSRPTKELLVATCPTKVNPNYRFTDPELNLIAGLSVDFFKELQTFCQNFSAAILAVKDTLMGLVQEKEREANPDYQRRNSEKLSYHLAGRGPSVASAICAAEDTSQKITKVLRRKSFKSKKSKEDEESNNVDNAPATKKRKTEKPSSFYSNMYQLNNRPKDSRDTSSNREWLQPSLKNLARYFLRIYKTKNEVKKQKEQQVFDNLWRETIVPLFTSLSSDVNARDLEFISSLVGEVSTPFKGQKINSFFHTSFPGILKNIKTDAAVPYLKVNIQSYVYEVQSRKPFGLFLRKLATDIPEIMLILCKDPAFKGILIEMMHLPNSASVYLADKITSEKLGDLLKDPIIESAVKFQRYHLRKMYQATYLDRIGHVLRLSTQVYQNRDRKCVPLPKEIYSYILQIALAEDPGMIDRSLSSAFPGMLRTIKTLDDNYLADIETSWTRYLYQPYGKLIQLLEDASKIDMLNDTDEYENKIKELKEILPSVEAAVSELEIPYFLMHGLDIPTLRNEIPASDWALKALRFSEMNNHKNILLQRNRPTNPTTIINTSEENDMVFGAPQILAENAVHLQSAATFNFMPGMLRGNLFTDTTEYSDDDAIDLSIPTIPTKETRISEDESETDIFATNKNITPPQEMFYDMNPFFAHETAYQPMQPGAFEIEEFKISDYIRQTDNFSENENITSPQETLDEVNRDTAYQSKETEETQISEDESETDSFTIDENATPLQEALDEINRDIAYQSMQAEEAQTSEDESETDSFAADENATLLQEALDEMKIDTAYQSKQTKRTSDTSKDAFNELFSFYNQTNPYQTPFVMFGTKPTKKPPTPPFLLPPSKRRAQNYE